MVHVKWFEEGRAISVVLEDDKLVLEVKLVHFQFSTFTTEINHVTFVLL